MTTGSSSVGTSAAVLTATSTTYNHQLLIKAAHGNTATVYIGLGSSVTAGTASATDGFELSAGETFSLGANDIKDVSLVYAISGSSSQKVFWVAT